MPDTPLAKKLQIRPGQRMALLNPPAGFQAALQPLPDGCEFADGPVGTLDYVHLFVQNREELAALWPAAAGLGKPDCLLWISYPKQSSGVATDINRDSGWGPVTASGLQPVRQVAIDDVWSALRFRPVDASIRR